MQNKDEVINNLVDLISHNPELPVIPMVSPFICGNELRTYPGKILKPMIKEVYTHEDKLWIKGECNPKIVVRDVYAGRKGYDYVKTPKDIRELFDELKWIKAIVVTIGDVRQ